MSLIFISRFGIVCNVESKRVWLDGGGLLSKPILLVALAFIYASLNKALNKTPVYSKDQSFPVGTLANYIIWSKDGSNTIIHFIPKYKVYFLFHTRNTIQVHNHSGGSIF